MLPCVHRGSRFRFTRKSTTHGYSRWVRELNECPTRNPTSHERATDLGGGAELSKGVAASISNLNSTAQNFSRTNSHTEFFGRGIFRGRSARLTLGINGSRFSLSKRAKTSGLRIARCSLGNRAHGPAIHDARSPSWGVTREAAVQFRLRSGSAYRL